MIPLLILAFLICGSRAQEAKQCSFDQGPVAFCRNTSQTKGDTINKWIIRVPKNAKQILLARMQDSEIVDSLVLQDEELDRRHVEPKPGIELLGSRDCKIEADAADFTLLLDMTDRKIQEGAWYILCGEYDAAEEVHETKVLPGLGEILGQPRAVPGGDRPLCTRCTMIKPVKSDHAPKFLKYNWVRDSVAQLDDSGILRYLTAELPFDSVKISGRVIDSKGREQVLQFERLIKSMQQIIVQVPRVEKFDQYTVTTDVIPQNKNGTDILINQRPLILIDYLRGERKENVPSRPKAEPKPDQQRTVMPSKILAK